MNLWGKTAAYDFFPSYAKFVIFTYIKCCHIILYNIYYILYILYYIYILLYIYYTYIFIIYILYIYIIIYIIYDIYYIYVYYIKCCHSYFCFQIKFSKRFYLQNQVYQTLRCFASKSANRIK